MAELEDLFLKRFRAEKVQGVIVATEDPQGRYRAITATEVEQALSTNKPTKVDVLIGNKWCQIRGSSVQKLAEPQKQKHGDEYYLGYRAGYNTGSKRS